MFEAPPGPSHLVPIEDEFLTPYPITPAVESDFFDNYQPADQLDTSTEHPNPTLENIELSDEP